MTEDIEKIFLEASCNNADAFSFCVGWYNYVHSIDDIVDQDNLTPDYIVNSFVNGACLFTSKFFLANHVELMPLVLLTANTYLDSIKMENSGTTWKRIEGDIIRSCGNDMITVVAGVCGGFENMKKVSMKLRELSYNTQRKEQLI